MAYPTDKPKAGKPVGKLIATAYAEEAEVDQFGLDVPTETVEVTFTSVIEEIVLGSNGRALFHELMSIASEYERNGVYKVPNSKGGNITVTVEGL